MFLGKGIAWAQGTSTGLHHANLPPHAKNDHFFLRKGTTHRRHRRILTPAFGATEMRALQPAFREVVQRVRCISEFSSENQVPVHDNMSSIRWRQSGSII